jgi:hypothetical protein
LLDLLITAEEDDVWRVLRSIQDIIVNVKGRVSRTLMEN